RAPADTFVASFLGNPPMNLLPAAVVMEAGRPQVSLAGHLLAVPRTDGGTLARFISRPIVFGIRPEDVRVQTGGAAPGLPGVVTTVEPLGAETLVTVHLDAIQQDLVLRAGRDCAARTGDRMTVTPDPAAAHLFDPDTTLAIAAGDETSRSPTPVKASA
ncbi:MAG: TOBE domain-containing protein, partial [Betaproteobacteria bacterium]